MSCRPTRGGHDSSVVIICKSVTLDVLFCDMPHIAPNATGRAMVHQMAVFAEWEAGVISERTKTTLAAYKARGGRLGTHDPRCPSLTPQAMAKGRTKAAATAKTATATAFDHVLPQMLQWRANGASLRQIAGLLNGGDHQTRTGCAWNYGQVKRVLDRATLLSAHPRLIFYEFPMPA
jgi:DNA invertase Pin-like site-specific DNA recombinase